MLNNKKAISTIVATVLIILITVAAVAILWIAVMPMIKDNLAGATGGCNDARLDLQIVKDEGKTCSNGTGTYVQVSRGAKGTYNLTSVQVIAIKDGTTLLSNSTTIFPGINEERVYILNETSANATKVKIAAIIKETSKNQTCEASQEVEIGAC